LPKIVSSGHILIEIVKLNLFLEPIKPPVKLHLVNYPLKISLFLKEAIFEGEIFFLIIIALKT